MDVSHDKGEGEKITGQCMEMCPKAEILLRERTRRLAVFEILAGTENNRIPKAQHNLCVKEYSRSAAGCEVEASTLRPAHVLLRCMNYLIDEILDQDKHGRSWVEVYDFVSDRVRSIRQDMTIQRIQMDIAVDILQKAVRFHIVVMEECKLDKNFDRRSCFDQLHGCLFPLTEYLKPLCATSLKHEFQLYYILLNINSASTALNMIRNLLQDSLYEKDSEYRKIILQLSLAYVLFNFNRLFKLFEGLPYIASCCLVASLSHLRTKSLIIIQKAYASRNSKLPLQALTKWLKFDSCEDTKRFCTLVGLKTESASAFLSGTLLVNPSEVENEAIGSDWTLIGIKKFKSVQDYVKEGDSF